MESTTAPSNIEWTSDRLLDSADKGSNDTVVYVRDTSFNLNGREKKLISGSIFHPSGSGLPTPTALDKPIVHGGSLDFDYPDGSQSSADNRSLQNTNYFPLPRVLHNLFKSDGDTNATSSVLFDTGLSHTSTNNNIISSISNNCSNSDYSSDDYFYDYSSADSSVPLDEILPVSLVYGVTLVIGVVGNLLVIAAVARDRRLRSITNIFLTSLASADLALLCFCVPVKVRVFCEYVCVYVDWGEVRGQGMALRILDQQGELWSSGENTRLELDKLGADNSRPLCLKDPGRCDEIGPQQGLVWMSSGKRKQNAKTKD
ncbi:uncharacterized protein LOC106012339 [Aplysia californica]|uniref:Uncharacterized protein LOC106012339 n=1 Tax=Aplysia californica TaxID=6500 RepID=A0ABM1A473_APLCA|nr:uncharacterized protein LOC106012339 [Aplysia californica]